MAQQMKTTIVQVQSPRQTIFKGGPEHGKLSPDFQMLTVTYMFKHTQA